MPKLEHLRFELADHPPFSPDLAHNEHKLFLNMKWWLQGTRFTSNEAVIVETKASFKDLGFSYEMLESGFIKWIVLEGSYVAE